MPIGVPVSLTDEQKTELMGIAQSRSLPAGYVFRAKLILLLAEGLSFSAIRERLGTTTPTIIRWKERFLELRRIPSDSSHRWRSLRRHRQHDFKDLADLQAKREAELRARQDEEVTMVAESLIKAYEAGTEDSWTRRQIGFEVSAR